MQGASWDSTRTKRFAAEANPITTNWYGIQRGAIKPNFVNLDLNNDGKIDQDEFNSFALQMAMAKGVGGAAQPGVAGTGMNTGSGDMMCGSPDKLADEHAANLAPSSPEYCIVVALSVVRGILGSEARDRLETKLMLPILVSPFQQLKHEAARYLPAVMSLLDRMVRIAH